MKDLMIDLETLGKNPNALVIQIGACYFDRITGEIGETFCQNIDINTSQEYDFTVDTSTIIWWLQQSKEAQESILKKPNHIKNVLVAFKEFAKDAKEIWSHATFDFVILHNTYKAVGIKFPFGYKTARDIRTLVDLANVPYTTYKREGMHHNALDDCKHQVMYCYECFKTLRGEKNA